MFELGAKASVERGAEHLKPLEFLQWELKCPQFLPRVGQFCCDMIDHTIRCVLQLSMTLKGAIICMFCKIHQQIVQLQRLIRRYFALTELLLISLENI